jgi:hypothetical protein
MSVDSIRSAGVSPMTSVRHGDRCGAVARTATPSGIGTSADRSDGAPPPAGATIIVP